MNESNDIAELSRLLNHCKTYNHDSFNKFLSENQELNNTSSALFNNIDGNHSNFDNFVTNISQYCHNFSFIGISETNIAQCHKNLYNIPGYTSEYNS